MTADGVSVEFSRVVDFRWMYVPSAFTAIYQLRITGGDSGLCCCAFVTSSKKFEL